MTDRTDPAEQVRSPRIIVGPLSSDDEAGRPRKTGHMLDWQKRFGRRSPLSRKIITFNLVALGMLVAGVLYLNQSQDGLSEMRERSMEDEARILSFAIRDALSSQALDGADRQVAIETVQALIPAIRGVVRVYDADGRFLGTTSSEQPEGTSPVSTPVDAPRQSALTSIMGDIWERLSRVFERGRDETGPLIMADVNRIAKEALSSGMVIKSNATNPAGQRIVTVAVPIITTTERVIGAVTLSTVAGDIDNVIRSERENILQVFALAMLSSIILSFVLANTIVRPLRDLAEAAQRGGTRDSRQVNPERIHIPDMTGRPDEIGFLSGAMQMMTTALYDRIEANEVFAADVAHEIKNPLTSLRSAVETMPYAKDEDSRIRLLSVIKNDVDRLDRLVTDISNASRLDSELVRDEMAEFDLNQLVANLIEYNQEHAADKGAGLVANINGELIVSGLEGRLAQVIVNLITNAISFSSEGDVISVTTEWRPGFARLLVEDNGPGIPDENLADVFSRFYSERPDQEFGNHSGLGLAISKQIVDAHGGSIWAENIRDAAGGSDSAVKGARFVVEIPA